MNDEDLFIFLTQILEKLESIDVQLKRLNFRQNNCEQVCEPPVCEPQPPVVYYEEPPVVHDYCEPLVYYEEPPVVYDYYEPPLDYYCYDSYDCYDTCTDCIYNPYYDYTLDYLIEYDECYDECTNYCYY